MPITLNGTTTVSVSGNLITADYSNTTLTARVSFQSSTTNGSTGIYALPNGTSTAASWQATNAADPTNASKILIATNGSTDTQLVSGRNGTGTYLPLSFYTNGSEQMRLNTSGQLGLGTASPSATLEISKSAPNDFTYTALKLTNTYADYDSYVSLLFSAGAGPTTVQHRFDGMGLSYSLVGPGSGSFYESLFDTYYIKNAAGTPTLTIGSTGNIGASGSVTTSAEVNAGTTVNDAIGNVRNVPQNAKTSAYTLIASDNGKHISITTGGVTVPSGVFSVGNTVTIYNNSAANQTITQGASVTMYLVGTATTGNRTLAQRGLCTIMCVAANTFVITGGGLT